jgi:hypothetical protein
MTRSHPSTRLACAAAALALISVPGVASAQDPPMTLSAVVNALKGNVPSGRVLQLATTRCISFRVDSEAARELRNANANSSFIQELRGACYRAPAGAQRPTTPTTPTTPATPTRPVGQPTRPTTQPARPTTPATPTTPAAARLVLDQDARGRLDGRSPRDDGYRHADWAFSARQGDRVVFNLMSDDFDAYLQVGRMAGGRFDEFDSNDDGGEGLNSRLVFDPPQTGEYVVRARGFSPDAEGAFTLRVQRHLLVSPRTSWIVVDQNATGTITDADARDEGGIPFQQWRFRAQGGQRMIIAAVSDDFDTFISVGRLAGDAFEELDWDDDGGEGLNSLLEWTAPATGEYVVRVRPYSASSRGSYAIGLRAGGGGGGGGGGAPAGRPTGATYEVSDALGAGSPVLPSGHRYADWTFSANAGESFRLMLQSGDFDTYLIVGYMRGAEFVELAYDDDGGEGTDSQLGWTAPATREYVVRVRPYGTAGSGSYWLGVFRQAGARPGTVGRDLTAALAPGDAVYDGKYAHEWAFTFRAGQRVSVSMSSSTIDTYLVVGRMVNGQFVEVARDDDGGGGTNSLAVFSASGGEYVVRATSFSPGETGPYTLRVDAR